MYKQHPMQYSVLIFADPDTGNPEYIFIGSLEFEGSYGAILASHKLLPGLKFTKTNYGIFEPSGIIEVTTKETDYNSRRFYFDQIDYINDCMENILIQLSKRFDTMVAWRSLVLNQ